MARDIFRFSSCEAIDVMRLRGRGRSLRKLVEIRGREHLEAALAGGKGAILCSAHYGSHHCAFSVLHASGFPFTTIGRWWWRYDNRRVFRRAAVLGFVYARRVLRHQQRPRIEPWPGRVRVAVQAAAALRANEVVSISSDTPPLDADRPRAVEVPFLGRQARLLPGVVTLARLTGAPVLMAIAHHSADYHHQVLEISPPVPMDGETSDGVQALRGRDGCRHQVKPRRVDPVDNGGPFQARATRNGSGGRDVRVRSQPATCHRRPRGAPR